MRSFVAVLLLVCLCTDALVLASLDIVVSEPISTSAFSCLKSKGFSRCVAQLIRSSQPSPLNLPRRLPRGASCKSHVLLLLCMDIGNVQRVDVSVHCPLSLRERRKEFALESQRGHCCKGSNSIGHSFFCLSNSIGTHEPTNR